MSEREELIAALNRCVNELGYLVEVPEIARTAETELAFKHGHELLLRLGERKQPDA